MTRRPATRWWLIRWVGPANAWAIIETVYWARAARYKRLGGFVAPEHDPTLPLVDPVRGWLCDRHAAKGLTSCTCDAANPPAPSPWLSAEERTNNGAALAHRRRVRLAAKETT